MTRSLTDTGTDAPDPLGTLHITAPGSTDPATAEPLLPVLAALQARIQAQGSRFMLGLVGPPGAGKSTVAAALAAHWDSRLPGWAQVVPMDGFHLAQVELERLGRAARKGAPDTFDSAGYAALLQRLRTPGLAEPVYAPMFRRDLEEPIAGAIAVPASVQLIITEGNYLLLEPHGWGAVRPQLDEVWYVEVDPALRLQRLQQRHQDFGRSAEAAREWVSRTDEPNARLIEASCARADRCVLL